MPPTILGVVLALGAMAVAVPARALSYVSYSVEVDAAIFNAGGSSGRSVIYETLPLFDPRLGALASIELTPQTTYGYSITWDTRIASSGVEFYDVGLTDNGGAGILLSEDGHSFTYGVGFGSLLLGSDTRRGTIEAGDFGSIVVGPFTPLLPSYTTTQQPALEAFSRVGLGTVIVETGFEANLECFSANPCGALVATAYEHHNLSITYGYVPAGTPEPDTWALSLLGFGGIGAALRFHRRRRRACAAAGMAGRTGGQSGTRRGGTGSSRHSRSRS
ncbi:MAG: hypothetical protein JF588_07320 [Caulobacterales bacterium]|nr:hypothetical protein [Caulobacterales bacterium]